MRLVIKLDDLSCLEQQERGSDEIYLVWSFHEKNQPATKTRMPPGREVWTGQTGSREQLDREVVAQEVAAGKEYVFELWLYEQDSGLLDKDDLLGHSALAIKTDKVINEPQILRATDAGAEYELTYMVTLT